MKIEEGKFYRTRNGDKVGPAVFRTVGNRCFWSVGNWHYSEDGVCSYLGWVPRADGDEYRSGRDLMAEWRGEQTGPVITETVKRINPGVYGAVEVLSGPTDTYSTSAKITMRNGTAFSPHLWFDAAELRAVAATLTEIADALEQSK